mmetsp:Transcript_11092/g.18595  ORF Transcript_11092/g.18595 Transcript_11092/m.18595 type:complete len:136 (-) Transcript_11092:1883-2290(-)
MEEEYLQLSQQQDALWNERLAEPTPTEPLPHIPTQYVHAQDPAQSLEKSPENTEQPCESTQLSKVEKDEEVKGSSEDESCLNKGASIHNFVESLANQFGKFSLKDKGEISAEKNLTADRPEAQDSNLSSGQPHQE